MRETVRSPSISGATEVTTMMSAATADAVDLEALKEAFLDFRGGDSRKRAFPQSLRRLAADAARKSACVARPTKTLVGITRVMRV